MLPLSLPFLLPCDPAPGLACEPERACVAPAALPATALVAPPFVLNVPAEAAVLCCAFAGAAGDCEGERKPLEPMLVVVVVVLEVSSLAGTGVGRGGTQAILGGAGAELAPKFQTGAGAGLVHGCGAGATVGLLMLTCGVVEVCQSGHSSKTSLGLLEQSNLMLA